MWSSTWEWSLKLYNCSFQSSQCVSDYNFILTHIKLLQFEYFHQNEKWKKQWNSLSHIQLFLTPWTTQSMEFSRPEYWNGQPFPSPGDLPNPGIELRSPTLQEDSLPAEPQGKPKNTGVGSPSLLQWVFLTQESNQGLLHCRQILYQLSSQGSPRAQSVSVFYEKAKRTTSSMFP